MGYNEERSIPLKQAVLEFFNLGFWGFSIVLHNVFVEFSFKNWENMCEMIDIKTWNTEILITKSNEYRFWFEPSYKISGRFLK